METATALVKHSVEMCTSGEKTMKIDPLLGQVYHFPLSPCAVALLAALAWTHLAFGGEIHDAAKAGDLSKVMTLFCRAGSERLGHYPAASSAPPMKRRPVLRWQRGPPAYPAGRCAGPCPGL